MFRLVDELSIRSGRKGCCTLSRSMKRVRRGQELEIDLMLQDLRYQISYVEVMQEIIEADPEDFIYADMVLNQEYELQNMLIQFAMTMLGV